MTLRHLQIFKTVCEKMSVTAAAEALGMTQPAVSIAVRELEGFYGVRLLTTREGLYTNAIFGFLNILEKLRI